MAKTRFSRGPQNDKTSPTHFANGLQSTVGEHQRSKEEHMLVTAITTWEGTPAALEGVVAGSKAAAPIHESLGAKNPRLMRSFAGGDVDRVEYMIDFDSFEACGAFTDAMMSSEWFETMMKEVAAAYPAIKNCGLRASSTTKSRPLPPLRF